jgi:xanthine dehydrogenase accessory factor
MSQALRYLIDSYRANITCALVTVVGIHGRSPRRLGAQMAISMDAVVGSLSGGCLDGVVIHEARRVLAQRTHHRLRIGEDSLYIDIVMPCGSGLDLQIDGQWSQSVITSMDQALSNRQSFYLNWRDANSAPEVSVAEKPDQLTILYRPRLRIIAAGASETLLAMCKVCRAAEIEIVALTPDESIIDQISALGVLVHVLNSAEQLPSIAFDDYSAAITLFHDHDWELHYLSKALVSRAFFVGAMGSPVANEARAKRLAEVVNTEQLQRLHAPIGLVSRAREPYELAVSILAELMQSYRDLYYPEAARQ